MARVDPIKIEIEVKVAAKEEERVDLNLLLLSTKALIEILEAYPSYSPNGEPRYVASILLSDLNTVKSHAYSIEWMLETAAKKEEKEPHPLQPLVDLIDSYNA